MESGLQTEFVTLDKATAQTPLLHFIPCLVIPEQVAIHRNTIACRMEINGSGVEPLTVALSVQQPLADPRRFVGCTPGSRYGAVVPLERVPSLLLVTLFWSLPPGQYDSDQTVYGRLTIRHDIALRLIPTDRGHIFSADLDAQSWWRSPRFQAERHQPYAAWESQLLQPERRECWRGLHQNQLRLYDLIEVPSCNAEDIKGFHATKHLQLHEITQSAKLSPDSQETRAHRINARLEMPAEVLVEAVRLARNIPFHSGTPYFRQGPGCGEDHPALRHLTAWWNSHCPDPAMACAAIGIPWVRVAEDGLYWPTQAEDQPRPIDRPMKTPDTAARIGDLLLIEFLQGHADAIHDGTDLVLFDVLGREACRRRVSHRDVETGGYDPASSCLSALATFPARFPAAWRWLTRASKPKPKRPRQPLAVDPTPLEQRLSPEVSLCMQFAQAREWRFLTQDRYGQWKWLVAHDDHEVASLGMPHYDLETPAEDATLIARMIGDGWLEQVTAMWMVTRMGRFYSRVFEKLCELAGELRLYYLTDFAEHASLKETSDAENDAWEERVATQAEAMVKMMIRERVVLELAPSSAFSDDDIFLVRHIQTYTQPCSDSLGIVTLRPPHEDDIFVRDCVAFALDHGWVNWRTIGGLELITLTPRGLGIARKSPTSMQDYPLASESPA
jgi:hypothetical protein